MSDLAASAYTLPTLLDAWESTLRSVGALGSRLTARQWEAPTECPGWSTGDVVRHLAWIETFLAGRRDPEHTMDWERFPHVDGDFGRLTETGVDVRRGLSQADACAELETVTDVRLAQIMALDPLTLETEVMGVFGRPVPLESLLRMRAFDSWTHLQDIRRATGLPGDLATPGAQVCALQLARSTPFVLARNIGAPAGTTMRVTVTGPIAFERWAGIDDDLRGVEVDELGRPQTPTIAIDTDWETYARLGTGRLDVADPAVLARMTLSGDAALAARIPEALAITP
jgi:uncharacterized protein (TIGR03083 family)